MAGNILSIYGPKGTKSGTVISLASAGLVSTRGLRPSPCHRQRQIQMQPLLLPAAFSTLRAKHLLQKFSIRDGADLQQCLHSSWPEIHVADGTWDCHQRGNLLFQRARHHDLRCRVTRSTIRPGSGRSKLTLPTPSPGVTGDTFVIEGSTLPAGGASLDNRGNSAESSYGAKRPLRLRTGFWHSISINSGRRIRVVGSSVAAGRWKQYRCASDRG